ncbi:MAG: hypothetical protein ACJ04O_01645 [Cellvibrionales bacterium]
MQLLLRILLIMLYPIVVIVLIIPHQIGHFFHKHYYIYLTFIALLLLTVSGYVGYEQAWDGDDDMIQFQIFVIAAALYSPFHFVITQPFETEFEQLNQWIIDTAMGGPPSDS